jgi:hypothetical protein
MNPFRHKDVGGPEGDGEPRSGPPSPSNGPGSLPRSPSLVGSHTRRLRSAPDTRRCATGGVPNTQVHCCWLLANVDTALGQQDCRAGACQHPEPFGPCGDHRIGRTRRRLRRAVRAAPGTGGGPAGSGHCDRRALCSTYSLANPAVSRVTAGPARFERYRAASARRNRSPTHESPWVPSEVAIPQEAPRQGTGQRRRSKRSGPRMPLTRGCGLAPGR